MDGKEPKVQLQHLSVNEERGTVEEFIDRQEWKGGLNLHRKQTASTRRPVTKMRPGRGKGAFSSHTITFTGGRKRKVLEERKVESGKLREQNGPSRRRGRGKKRGSERKSRPGHKCCRGIQKLLSCMKPNHERSLCRERHRAQQDKNRGKSFH